MLVIGNGESRAEVDIGKLNCHKIGCNAIHRDFKVNDLVCIDKKPLIEAINSSYHKNTKVYTRKQWWAKHILEPNIKCVPDLPYKGDLRPDDPWHWGSGPYAVLLAAMKDIQTIHMLGFDLYSKDKTVNNIYKGTENYARVESRAVDPRYWIYQIGKIFECFPNKKFVVYNDDWKMPEQWKKSNVLLDSICNI